MALILFEMFAMSNHDLQVFLVLGMIDDVERNLAICQWKQQKESRRTVCCPQ